MSTWLKPFSSKDGKLSPGNNKSRQGSTGSISPSPSPNLSKISLPAKETTAPKVVLSHEDDNSSPMTVSSFSIHRDDSQEGSTQLSEANGHRKYATISNDQLSSSANAQRSSTTPTQENNQVQGRTRTSSDAVVDGAAAGRNPLTDSPTQSASSRRSGSVTSGDSVPYQSLQQVVESPTPIRPRAISTADNPDKETSKARSRGGSRGSRQHSSSIGAGSPPTGIAAAISRVSGKPQSRHQNTMGMGLASALVASGMGIAAPPSMLPPPQAAALSPTIIRRQPSNVSSGKPNGSPERTRTRTRQRSSSSVAAGSVDLSGSDSEGYDSGDALSFGDEEIPITGFAVATMKRNQEFHEIFPNVPVDDYLIDDYGCALQRDILVQGRLYVSENHICFYANIFGWVTNLVIPVNNVSAIEKKLTAFVIPNAIGITDSTQKYTFASFLARDTAYDVIYSVWRNNRPGRASAGSPGSDTNLGMDSRRDSAFGSAHGEAHPAGKARRATQCACSKAGAHYNSTAMEVIFPGTPEQIYNLMFASGFIKDFLAQDQKLLDIQTSDWQPSATDAHLLARNMSYIKPLGGSFGPKQTKCELRDENQHVDYNDYVSTITTTRTPDVPSGGVFAVKTRTCIMWAGSSTSKVTVTFTVEWTGKSFIKGIIEKSCGDGQKGYYVELEAAMRKYIHDHRTEFLPEGLNAAEAEAEAEEAALSPTSPTELSKMQGSEKPVATSRGLQWALDTFEAASKVATDSISGLLDIVTDLWGGTTRTTILTLSLVFLILSNLYTIFMMGERQEIGRKQAVERRESERERWVGDAVKAFLEVQQSFHGIVPTAPQTVVVTPPALPTAPVQIPGPASNIKEEIAELLRVAATLEERVALLKSQLEELD